jgi:UDP-N-acetylglucosamine 2-epimerase
MTKKIKICCITGTRADYPRVKSVLHKINNNQRFELQIIVTGSHLLESHGNSFQEIVNDDFKIDKKVPMYTENFNTPYGMATATSRCIKV